MNLKECALSSLKSLLSNKMRSFLTMLGIIIGISSVIMISTLGTGGQESISKTFGDIAKNTSKITINPEPNTQIEERDFFTSFDVDLISQVEGIKYASLNSSYYAYKTNENTGEDKFLGITAGNENLPSIMGMKFLYGRSFNKVEVANGKKVIVIDDHMANIFFGRKDVIGRQINITTYMGANQKFLIVGIIENPFKDFMKTTRQDILVPFMPLKTAEKYIGDNDGSVTLTFSAKNIEEKSKVEGLVLKTLEGIKKKKGVYKVDNSDSQEIGSFNKVLNIVNIFISAVAAISLFVGGIGVMNIMLVTVTERTKEIGIRKSLGAKRRDILIQFLIEAVILTFIGGAIGLSIGYFGAKGIGSLINITPILKPHMLILAIGVSSSIGIIFGVFPANKASKLNPIDALRYE